MSVSVTEGNFSTVPGIDSWEASLLQDAYDAITTTETWEYFRTFSEQSFMFSRSAELKKVQADMKTLDTHSGSSYGFVMRTMESIAKNGWESWVAARIKYQNSKH
jgi:hypothetical protein